MILTWCRRLLLVLLGTAILIPCAVTLLVLFARFLSLMGNVVAANLLDATSLVLAILWLLALAAILLILAARAIREEESHPHTNLGD